MKYVWKYLQLAMVVLWSLAAGSWYHERNYGEVRVFTNVEIPGDKYNRGQKTIDIAFPKGLEPKYIWLPDGQMYPDDSKARWIEIVPDRGPKNWIDRLSFEIADRPKL